MSDRIAVLNDGRIEQVGRPEELYETPSSAFVADFIGETNFLTGMVVSIDGDECRLHLDGAGTAVGRIAPGGVAVGATASLAVRPDRIRLDDAAGVEGEIAERIYSGAALTLVIRLAPGTVIMARGASNGADAGRAVGEPVHVSWHARDARVYPGTGR